MPSNVGLINSESGAPLNSNSKVIINKNNSIQKESNENIILNRRRYKSNVLTRDTLASIQSYKIEYENLSKYKDKEYPLIKIKADNEKNYFPMKAKYILDNYDYNEAIEYENRNYLRIFFIFLI